MEKVAQYVLTALICSVAVGQFIQVFTRYVLQVPLMGLEESVMFPTIWLYVLGAVNASRENTHIRANVLEIFLKTDRQQTILAIFGEVVSLAIGLWLLTWVWEFTAYSWGVWKESPTLYIPTFWGDVSLMAGMVLMMGYTIWHLLAHIRILKAGSAL